MTVQLNPRSGSTHAVHRFTAAAEGLGRYDIDVSLPPEYAESVPCSVIYVLDGNLLFETARSIVHGYYGVGVFPNSIVIGVGYPSDEGFAGFYSRRNHDFHGPWDMTDELGQMLHGIFNGMKSAEGKPDMTMVAGGADRFMAFLRDELHVAVAERYSVDGSGRHTLIGDSSGGHFVLRALYDPDSHFSRYVCISPGFASAAGSIQELEAAYAATHDDMDVDVFLCAGDDEMNRRVYAMCRIVSGVAWVREQFACRRYPSARVAAEIMNNEDHASIAPRAISQGLRFVHGVPLSPGAEAFD